MPKHGSAALLVRDPGAIHPRGLMPDMLVVPALELGDPVLFIVQMIADDFLLHAGRFVNDCSVNVCVVKGSPFREFTSQPDPGCSSSAPSQPTCCGALPPAGWTGRA